MKKSLCILLFSLVSILTNAQNSKVNWETEIIQDSDSIFTITLHANIESGWHLYSQNLPESSTIPTSFKFTKQEGNYTLLGKTLENKPITKFDKVFEMELSYFENKATFIQKIKLLNPNIKLINIIAAYQICDDLSCIFEHGEEITIHLYDSKIITDSNTIVDERSELLKNQLKLNIKNKEQFLNLNKATTPKEKSLFGIFILGFFGGLIALLTPCVFPMIPLTVSFFTKQGKEKKKGVTNALIYGFFIIFIYFLLSIPFHLMDSLDPEILNNISTNVWLNVAFFGIFMFFAFSFFGFYEITLPNSWGNKTDTASTNGGLIGIFFMAVTLAIVSFSCTGPILGSLLVGSLTADGGAIQLSAGMIGFGFALSLPFTLFALFPNLLNSLPKSGGWLTTVKVVLGFLEVALALKFLSNADLVEHWGFLKREVFLALWILIFLGLSIYLFGKIKFPHDNPKAKLSNTRIGLGAISSIFTLYLISGLFFNTSLKALSGFPPPQFYSIFETNTDCPLNLNCFKDFEEGYAYAKEHNKPIMLDFTGWACVNCRKMEENVWSATKVHDILNQFVIISLYVDDKQRLPKEKQFDFKKPNGKLKKIKTIGSKWATFQAVNFETASQPYYVLLSPELKLLNYPEEYEEQDAYLSWLQTGLANFNK